MSIEKKEKNAKKIKKSQQKKTCFEVLNEHAKKI